MLSNGCEASGQLLDHGEPEMGGGVVDAGLVVLGETSVAAVSGKGPLDPPSDDLTRWSI